MPKQSWAEYAGRMLSQLRTSSSWFWSLEARLKGVQVGRGVLFVGRPLISVAQGARFQIGNNVTINRALRSNPLGCFQPSVLRALCSNAELVLDANVGISGCVLCAANSIQIGEGTNIGSGALLMDTDFHQPTGQWEWGTDPGREPGPFTLAAAYLSAPAPSCSRVSRLANGRWWGRARWSPNRFPPRHFAVGNPARNLPIPDTYFAAAPKTQLS